MQTAWPYGADVRITLTMPADGDLDLVLRVPAWLAAPSLAVTVDGAVWPTAGAPGSYLHIRRSWSAGAPHSITLALPMALTAQAYGGHSQLPPYARYSYLYGPILLSFSGMWNETVDALVMPPAIAAPDAPATWLQAAPDGNMLHFVAPLAPGLFVQPYYELQDPNVLFSNFPAFH